MVQTRLASVSHSPHHGQCVLTVATLWGLAWRGPRLRGDDAGVEYSTEAVHNNNAIRD